MYTSLFLKKKYHKMQNLRSYKLHHPVSKLFENISLTSDGFQTKNNRIWMGDSKPQFFKEVIDYIKKIENIDFDTKSVLTVYLSDKKISVDADKKNIVKTVFLSPTPLKFSVKTKFKESNVLPEMTLLAADFFKGEYTFHPEKVLVEIGFIGEKKQISWEDDPLMKKLLKTPPKVMEEKMKKFLSKNGT